MKDFFANKPWKSWATRKTVFIYNVILGTTIIITGGVAMFVPNSGIDTAAWMEQSMGFLKFTIGTGTLITLLPLKELVAFLTGKTTGGDE